MKKIILASASPRRKQLLEQIGVKFEICPSNIEEILDPRLSPRKQVEVLSVQKAKKVAQEYSDAIILSADTMVSFDGEVFGKPKDAEDATVMLNKLSGKVHSVVTGFTLLDTKTLKTVTGSTETKLWFRKISKEEIKNFIIREKPYDKAGAYAVHELASIFVEKIEGDFFGAVGLSVFLVAKELKKFGIKVL